MKITILYDNYSLVPNVRFKWGFSCLIEAEKTILFDTGSSEEDLLFNMQRLGMDPAVIDYVVISHSHWDHVGGILAILSKSDQARLVVGEHIWEDLDPEIKNLPRKICIQGMRELCAEVFTTGEMQGYHKDQSIFEQSLVLKTAKGIVAVVGCSHSGVGQILRKASEFGPVTGLIGGLHGFDNFELLKKLDLIVPTHCTVYRDEIKKTYPETTELAGVGWSMTL